jgi:hypothetical protein
MFKPEEEILVPDRRFAALYGVNASGVTIQAFDFRRT